MNVKPGFNILAVTGTAIYAGVMPGGHWKSLPATDSPATFENSVNTQ